MITKTYKDQYKRNGQLYDSLKEMKEKEQEKINSKLADFIDQEYKKTKDKSYHYFGMGYEERMELIEKNNIIKDYEKIRHIFFDIEQEREKLNNELRLFAWKESFFPNSFVWTGLVDCEE